MKKNFTKLVCVGIACFCMSSAMPQESMTAFSKVAGTNFRQDEVSLRADEVEYWWPDSVIYLNYLGEPDYKSYYDKENRTGYSVRLENDKWVIGETYSSDGFYFFSLKPTYNVDSEGKHYFYADHLFWVGTVPLSELFIAKTIYDNKGNLIFLEFSIDFSGNGTPRVWHTYSILYNEKNNPVLIEYYSANFRIIPKTCGLRINIC